MLTANRQWVDSLVSLQDFLFAPIFFILLLLIVLIIRKRNSEKNYFGYFLPGFFVKIFASLAFCLVYTLYYEGGDTISYFQGAVAMNKLLLYRPSEYFDILFGNSSPSAWNYFTYETGWPPGYMWRDPYSFFVIKLVSPIVLIAGNTYYNASILLASIVYLGSWKLYRFFIHFYPGLYKQFALCVLFVPSVVFWGSGIMKDTITFFALGYLVYNILQIFIKKEKIYINILIMVGMIMIIINIKPYIFVALAPAITLWISHHRITLIKNKIIRTLAFPSVIIFSIVIISVIFSAFGDQLGLYGSIESIEKQAQVIQKDLTREMQYGSNYYDIGKIDLSPSGIITLGPKALTAGLFRPFIWEARNVVNVMSGLENLFILFFTIFLVFKSGLINFFVTIFSEPLVMFSFVFSVIFLFSVGMATANFGALVRYKIPGIPFFLATLFIVSFIKQQEKKNKDNSIR